MIIGCDFESKRWFNLLKHLYKQSQLGRNNTQGVKSNSPASVALQSIIGVPLIIKGHKFKLSGLCVTFPPPTLYGKNHEKKIYKKKKSICFGVTPDSSLPRSVALDSSTSSYLQASVSSCVDPLSHRWPRGRNR